MPLSVSLSSDEVAAETPSRQWLFRRALLFERCANLADPRMVGVN